MHCDFCHFKKRKYFAENDLVFAVFDRSPVGLGHILIIPRRHFKSFFEATEEEICAIYDLMKEVKEKLDVKYDPDGYNIRVNCGRTAGQSVMHMHIHLIPRYKGDESDTGSALKKISKAVDKHKSKQ